MIQRVYKNHHLNNLRWKYYQPRQDDIIITSGFKSGTTWTQAVCVYLIYDEIQETLEDLAPWIELEWHNINLVVKKLEKQKKQRILKSHLAFDGIPYYPQVKYVVLSRDIRDIGMSLWNHYVNYTSMIYEKFPSLPRCPSDIHEFWDKWISQGWFQWEKEGYPFWGVMHHIQTWWEVKDRPNILFIHYNDLLLSFQDTVKRLCDFLNIPISKAKIEEIKHNTSIEMLKQNSHKIWRNPEKTWKNGGKTFFYKGVNGRWKTVLSQNELIAYENTASLVMDTGCRKWVEYEI